MHIMMDITFPSQKSDEVGKAFIDYIQTNPIPEYVKLTEYLQSWGGDGILGHLFYDLDDANIREAHKYITNGAWAMTKKVEGYRVLNQDVVVNMVEAYEYLGTQSPV